MWSYIFLGRGLAIFDAINATLAELHYILSQRASLGKERGRGRGREGGREGGREWRPFLSCTAHVIVPYQKTHIQSVPALH